MDGNPAVSSMGEIAALAEVLKSEQVEADNDVHLGRFVTRLVQKAHYEPS